jgi:VCBS repeat-containing protein
LKVIFFIAVFIPLTLKAQFNFEPDSIVRTRNIHLGIPDPDSIKFEFRLWNNSTHYGLFAQLTLNTNDQWNYRAGIEQHNAEIQYFETSSDVNIRQLWLTLDSLGVRTLLSQDSVRASIVKDGRTYKLTPNQFDKFLATDAAIFEVELFNGNHYRTYYYYSPIRLSERFSTSKEHWIADEHHAMANIIRTVNEALDLTDNFEEFLQQFNKKEDNNR